jgi:hypothetical protein
MVVITMIITAKRDYPTQPSLRRRVLEPRERQGCGASGRRVIPAISMETTAMITEVKSKQPRAKRLAAALLRDRHRERPTPARTSCFACGRTFPRRDIEAGSEASSRFCSDQCRRQYDDGVPVAAEPRDSFATEWRVAAGGDPGHLAAPMRAGSRGFLIECPGCGKQFDSSGLRFCSTDCRHRHRERAENAQLMAEVGIDQPIKRKCASCGGPLQVWRKGRRVSAATRFCSPRCRRKHAENRRMVWDSAPADLRAETAKKCP